MAGTTRTFRRARQLLSATYVLLAVLCAACASPPALSEPETATVRGLLTDVQSASISILREIEVRTDEGRTFRFTVEGDTGITPGHAREHMVNAEPVTVTYRSSAGERVALRIDD